MRTTLSCHFACTQVQILLGLDCSCADAALMTAHPSHNAPQSEVWLKRREVNLLRVFCFVFRP